jgi:cell wall-associated NlpC family hydrolase
MDAVRFRRTTTLRWTFLLPAVVGLLLTLVVPLTKAEASIASAKAEIAALSTTLAQLERQSEVLANKYDADRANLVSLDNAIYRLEAQETTKKGEIATTSSALVNTLVRTYVDGAAEAQILSLFDQDVTKSDARTLYQDEVLGNLKSLDTKLSSQKTSLDATFAQVALKRSEAAQQTASIQATLAENARNESSTRAALATVTAAYRTQIIEYEVAVAVSAARSKKSDKTAIISNAVAAASAVGGQTAANQVLAAVNAVNLPKTIAGTTAGTAQGLAALAAAKSQIGVPYLWGGETPGHGFDCSGLVQWAWAKAGISIPRTSETQWADLQHISLSELRPGDLLFYYNLDDDNSVDHVVMYAGSGPWGTDTIIAAAHTGTDVSLAPIFTYGLIGAARP